MRNTVFSYRVSPSFRIYGGWLGLIISLLVGFIYLIFWFTVQGYLLIARLIVAVWRKYDSPDHRNAHVHRARPRWLASRF
jgi:hypothetical protein